jgi:hypothetical protein
MEVMGDVVPARSATEGIHYRQRVARALPVDALGGDGERGWMQRRAKEGAAGCDLGTARCRRADAG